MIVQCWYCRDCYHRVTLHDNHDQRCPECNAGIYWQIALSKHEITPGVKAELDHQMRVRAFRLAANSIEGATERTLRDIQSIFDEAMGEAQRAMCRCENNTE